MTYDPTSFGDKYIADEPVDWYIFNQRREKLLCKFIVHGILPSVERPAYPSVGRYAPERVEQKPRPEWLIPFVLIGVIFLCFAGLLAFYYMTM